MASLKWIVIAAISIASATLAFTVLSASGNNNSDRRPLDGMMNGMMEAGRGGMKMQAPEDVMILLESEWKVPTGKQSEVVLKVLDKQTNSTMQGAEVIIGIEKGLPMTTMDMTGGMFNAEEKGDGTYAFKFTPESDGYYSVHAHVIPPGEQMHSMMDNHVDLVIIAEE